MFTQKESKETSTTKKLIDVIHPELFNTSYEEFIKIIKACIPEAAYLNKKANASAEGIAALKTTKNFYGLTADEEIRAFAGLLRFKDVINGTKEAYNNFVECQIQMKKPVLSFESFTAMKAYVEKTLPTKEDMAAAIWSILCNDLGKVHDVQAQYSNSAEVKVCHDAVLAHLLKQKPQIFEGFMALPESFRERIAAGYASECDISQFEQFELPVVSLEALKKLDKKALDHYILHSIFDVSGAAALFRSNGSLTMHQETWDFFNSTRECLEKLHEEKFTIEDAYSNYLRYRGERVGLVNKTTELTPELTALIRIAGLSRLATPEQGSMLKEVWDALSSSEQSTLTEELNVHGGKGKRAIFIGYGVAMLVNSQNAMIKEVNDKAKLSGQAASPEQIKAASKEGLQIGLINFAKFYQATRKLIGNDSSKDMFVAECEEIAKALSRDPKATLKTEWIITSKTDRRIDFNFKEIPTLVVSNTTPKTEPKLTVASNGIFAHSSAGTRIEEKKSEVSLALR